MRWLGRGRRHEGQPAGEQDAPPAGSSAMPAAAPDPGWTALPPIRPTWTAGASPLTTRSDALLRPPLVLNPPPRRVSSRPLGPDDVTPDPGVVVGLAVARPLPTTPIVAVPAQFPDQPP